MSDFKSPFWSYWIAAIAIGGLIFVTVLLVSQLMAKTNKPGEEHLKPHVWDEDLQEYNNPMPRWWTFMFLGSIFFSIAYFFAYPALGAYKGYFNWSTASEYDKELKEIDARTAPLYQQFLQTPITQLAENQQAMALGERMFQNNCAQCHGTDATGFKGFPNLTDSDWLYGGFPDAIQTTLLAGRNGIMPSQSANLKTPVAVDDVANYVLSLSGTPHDVTSAARGKEKFELCATCHMSDGKGSLSDKTLAQFGVGAPDLTDNTWLYDGDLKTVKESINNGRNGIMPAWECTLGQERLHVLTAYVWQLNRDDSGKVLNPTEPADYMLAEVGARMSKLDAQRSVAREQGKSECLATSLHEEIRLSNEKKSAESSTLTDQKTAVIPANTKK